MGNILAGAPDPVSLQIHRLAKHARVPLEQPAPRKVLQKGRQKLAEPERPRETPRKAPPWRKRAVRDPPKGSARVGQPLSFWARRQNNLPESLGRFKD